ncbi:stage II sporulation protein D [Clostridium akagii]|uniref:stage II sporulation protein D n=1 Tax=Clostridium akagii TaxID=91623 RepID=UPI00047D135B|nr:stage II sporulation protein D [Clostridium akagii]
MLKKFIILIFTGSLFLIIVSICIGGFSGNKDNGKIGNSDGDIEKYNFKPNDIVFNNKDDSDGDIKVYIAKNKEIVQLSLEEYTRGVVAAEMPAEFNIEALKAQAIAARTFAAAHMLIYGGKPYPGAKGADVTDTVECQVYMDKDHILNKWPQKSVDEYWNKITGAVQDTQGEILKYNGKLVMEPLYFAVSRGKTEDSKEVIGDDEPYLKSVISSGEESAPKYKSSVKISYGDFINKINKAYKNSNLNYLNIKSSIEILSRTKGEGVKEIKLGKNTITGTKFRSIMGLNSTDFNIKYNIMSLEINCVGYGHDIGMSQWGANIMAKSGKNYRDILNHYYTGISIEKISK